MTQTPHLPEVFALPSEMTIYTVVDTRDQLLAWLERQVAFEVPAEPLRLSGALVDEVDGAGLQLLLSFQASVRARQRSWRLVSPSDSLVQACRDLGMTAWIAHH